VGRCSVTAVVQTTPFYQFSTTTKELEIFHSNDKKLGMERLVEAPKSAFFYRIGNS